VLFGTLGLISAIGIITSPLTRNDTLQEQQTFTQPTIFTGGLPSCDKARTAFIHAIAMVESGTPPYKNNRIKGDNGKSLGPFQISEAYWIDADVDGMYADCVYWHYSVNTMWAYWCRYALDAVKNDDFETLARIHNGGPNGHKKHATIKYWNKVKKEMSK
jgi:hypothetical protein